MTNITGGPTNGGSSMSKRIKIPYTNSPQDTGKPTDTNNCAYCMYSHWAVALGQGFYCTNASKLNQEGSIPNSFGYRRWNIPRRTYRCEFYEWNGKELLK